MSNFNRDPFDNDFFKEHGHDFNRTVKKGFAGFAGAGCLVLLINIALFCGAVYFVFWCLQHFGVI